MYQCVMYVIWDMRYDIVRCVMYVIWYHNIWYMHKPFKAELFNVQWFCSHLCLPPNLPIIQTPPVYLAHCQLSIPKVYKLLFGNSIVDDAIQITQATPRTPYPTCLRGPLGARLHLSRRNGFINSKHWTKTFRCCRDIMFPGLPGCCAFSGKVDSFWISLLITLPVTDYWLVPVTALAILEYSQSLIVQPETAF